VYGTSFTFSWSGGGNPGVTPYFVDVSTRADYSPIGYSSETTSASLSLTGLAGETTYYARVWARNGEGVYTSTVSLSTATQGVAPGVVSTLTTAQIPGHGVHLAWSAPGDDDDAGTAAYYSLRYSSTVIITDEATWLNASVATAAPLSVTLPVPSSAGTPQQMDITNLLVDSTYYWSLRAVDELGQMSPVYATAVSTWITNLVPSAPTTVSPGNVVGSTVTYSTITATDITWGAAADPDADAVTYTLEYTTNNGVSWVPLTSTPTASPYAWPLPPDETNEARLRIRTVDPYAAASGWTESTYNFAIVVPDTIAPQAVNDFAASPGTADGTVNLFWTSTGDDGNTKSLSPGSKFVIEHTTNAAYVAWSTTTAQVVISTSGVGPGASLAYTVSSGLLAGSSHYFRLWAMDEAGNPGALSNGATAQAMDAIPPSVGVVEPPHTGYRNTLTALSGTALDTSPGSGLSRVRIQLIDNSNGQYWNGGVWGGAAYLSTTSFAGDVWGYNGGLPTLSVHGTSYTVHAVADDYWGRVTTATTRFTADLQAPAKINNLSALNNGYSGQITLTWTVPSDDTGDGTLSPASYRVAFSSTANFVPGAFDAQTLRGLNNSGNVGNTHSYIVTGLTDGATYYFRIKSLDAAGNGSAVSDEVTAPNAFPGDLIGPNIVTTLATPVNVSPVGSVRLTWSVPRDDGPYPVPASFDVRASTSAITNANFAAIGNSTVIAIDSTTVGVGDTVTATVTGLTVGKLYYFGIKSYDYFGNVSGINDPIQALSIASDPAAPAAISPLRAETGSTEGAVKLAWSVPNDDDGDPASGPPLTYDIRYATGPFGEAAFGSLSASSRLVSNGGASVGSEVSFSVTGLTPGGTYYFRIKSIDDVNQTSPVDLTSPQAQAVAKDLADTAIKGNVTQANGTPIHLVLVEAMAVGSETVLASARSNAGGEWRLDGLTAGALYTVRVSWTVDEVTSSAFRENIRSGTSGVNFNLEINIQLATINGTVALARSAVPSGAYGAPVAGVGAAYVEIYQQGRKIGEISTDVQGRYVVPNLLPGRYAVRAFNGLSYSELQDVTLAEGQVLTVQFKFDLLPEDKVYFYPNPARNQVVIRFESSVQPLEAQALVFDIAGALVREFPGSESVRVGAEVSWTWDLSNAQGEPLASGVYLVQVKVHDPATNRRTGIIKKLAVIR
ncbi:MAG TPA: fibronectin type III domain-containing protein, partial [Elusimicrobiota bacterium]|nr:fibronectin type III domain-containing protein [Elusimicrobiota bacterium]